MKILDRYVIKKFLSGTAFGLVAFVAMAPLIAIQLLGLLYKSKVKSIQSQAEDSDIMDLSGGKHEATHINRS